MAKADLARTGSTIRCAIYTRKSSDEGLEQEFNSLDAQREACEAYIVSQRHAGWVALADMYDDGGLSGGTMERPALKRLLEDIKAGKVQIVVVYKVDRLTRSLADFAKIVDIFDAYNASFVSVTQQFNTTTSMGRLTLNMLLSFAQFEREIAGERIRDKIAASKRKGMWMGGNVPLGYDVKDRKLIINEPEAATVRVIFRRYAELGSVALLKAELDRLGLVSKRRGSLPSPFCRPASLPQSSMPQRRRTSRSLASPRPCPIRGPSRSGELGASLCSSGDYDQAPKGALRTSLCEKSNRSPLCRNGNWKIASRDRRPKPAHRTDMPEICRQRLRRVGLTCEDMGGCRPLGKIRPETELPGCPERIRTLESRDARPAPGAPPCHWNRSEIRTQGSTPPDPGANRGDRCEYDPDRARTAGGE